MDLSDFKKAEELARKAIEAAPDQRDSSVYGARGTAAPRLRNYREAGEWFVKALAVTPTEESALRGLAELHLERKEYEKAIDAATRLVKFSPTSPWNHANLLEVYLRAGRLSEAERALAASLSALSSPTGERTLLRQDAEKGVETARQALKISADYEEPSETYPFTPVAEHTLGLAALKKGPNAEAVRLLELAARLRPDRVSIREDLQRARGRLK